ncbi:hypothetical protein STEG23_032342 [Scotinomys teguina]
MILTLLVVKANCKLSSAIMEQLELRVFINVKCCRTWKQGKEKPFTNLWWDIAKITLRHLNMKPFSSYLTGHDPEKCKSRFEQSNGCSILSEQIRHSLYAVQFESRLDSAPKQKRKMHVGTGPPSS